MMDCTRYDELMSLHLDGLLPDDDVRSLLTHIEACHTCGPVWDALRSVDDLLTVSASYPLTVAAEFTSAVMLRVAAAPRLVLVDAPQFGGSVALPSILPSIPGAGPLHVPDLPWQEWQGRLAAYVRGFAAAGLGVAVLFSVLLALVVSGSMPVDPAFAQAADTFRAFFSATDIWVNTLVRGIDTQAMVVGGAILSLVSAAGWQIITNYHRSAADVRLEIGHTEAAA